MGTITDKTLPAKFDPILGKKFAIETVGPRPPGFISGGHFFWHNANPNKPSVEDLKINPDGGDPKYPGKNNPTGTAKPYRYAGEIQLGLSQDQRKNPMQEFAKEIAFTNNPPLGPDPKDPIRGQYGGKCTKGFHVSGTVVVDEA